LNRWIAGAPLSLWLPFEIYRDTHLAHHRTERLTEPGDDPESFYLSPESWRAAGPVRRALAIATNTLIGRLLLGPALVIARTAATEIRGRDRRRLGIWARHLIAVAAVMWWVAGVCDVHPLLYLGAFVYPGLSITLLRSFAEHRPAADRDHRSAVVEAHPIWSALFLNNNLHALHHAEPWRPWYQLPARYRDQRSAILQANGGYLIRGYGELARRYGVRVKDSPAHPGDRSC
jgi:fatty acid desaturase